VGLRRFKTGIFLFELGLFESDVNMTSPGGQIDASGVEEHNENWGNEDPPPPPPQQPMQPTQPVQAAPAAAPWMVMPSMQAGQVCPPGLEYFSVLSQLVVKQRIEILEALTGFEQQNKYDVFNSWGQKLYEAKEDSNVCARNCCGKHRGFDMRFMDCYKQTVIHFSRPLALSCCNCCCLSVMTVEAPVNVPIGRVRQMPGNCKVRFKVECPIGTHVATVCSPCALRCFCFSSVPYPIYDLSDREIAVIKRKFTAKGVFTDADNFTIEFDPMLNVNLKACLMGALFLIDFMFYEESGNNNKPGSISISL